MISVVVPNFNSGERLVRNLPRLLGLLGKAKLEYEVIVVDDASTDDSVAEIKRQKLKVKIIENDRNRGFGTTVDAGIRAAKGEVVFTIKTDAIPKSSDYFSLLLPHFENPRVFAVSAALRTIEKGKVEIRGQGVLIFFRGMFLHFRTYDDYVRWFDTMRSTKWLKKIGMLSGKLPPISSILSVWADGGAMVVKKDYYLKLGGFDPLYNPFYWEDTDLGYRAWKAGYEIHFEPRAILLHDYESGAIRRHYSAPQVKRIGLTHQFIFLWKNADLKHFLLGMFWWPYHALVALKNADGDFFVAHLHAKLNFLAILEARRRQKTLTKLSDDRVLRVFQERNR